MFLVGFLVLASLRGPGMLAGGPSQGSDMPLWIIAARLALSGHPGNYRIEASARGINIANGAAIGGRPVPLLTRRKA